jgi:hypothetical protein
MLSSILLKMIIFYVVIFRVLGWILFGLGIGMI